MEEIKICILLVYYKRPNIVLNALDSIKALKYNNWELNFIDDSGDDSFKETLFNYGLDNDKIKYRPIFDSDQTKLEQNGSRHGEYMNLSIKETDAEVIVVLCDDDALVDDYFTKINEFYHNNSEINWSFCNLFFFNPEVEHYTQGINRTSTDYRNHGSTYNLNIYKGPINPVCAIDGSQINFRRKVFIEKDLWYPSPQTKNLDAAIFTHIVNNYGLCYPMFTYGQVKGAFADQLGNRGEAAKYHIKVQ